MRILLSAFVAIALALVVAYSVNGMFMQRLHTRAVSNSSDKLMPNSFALSSPAFENNGLIPQKYACDGEGISPPLLISNPPANAKSFALIVIDPDVPKAVKPAGRFVHWILYDVPPITASIAEGEAPGVAGQNGAGKDAYAAPCPPPQYEPAEHRYVFTAYALDTTLALGPGATEEQLVEAMGGHVLDQALLVGRYSQKR